MSSLDPEALDIAEQHPRILNSLIAAMAQTETKAPMLSGHAANATPQPKEDDSA